MHLLKELLSKRLPIKSLEMNLKKSIDSRCGIKIVVNLDVRLISKSNTTVLETKAN